MNNYELTVILKNKDVENLIDTVKGILEKHGITIVKDESPGIKRLAYDIDGEGEGYYLFLILEAPADSVTKVISDFRLNNNVLRHLFVKMKKAQIA